MTSLHSKLRAGLLAGVGVIVLQALPAAAQDMAAAATASAQAVDEADVVEEILVTARRRTESLQDVPIAVTAISGESLERAGSLDITAIAETTPNVTLENSRGTNSTLTAFIRGVGQQDPVSGFEAGVGIYLDDVYLNRPQAAVLDIYEVERVEVLRGPQGTLYGRNTIGGAVKYVSRRLSDEPTFRFTGRYGEDDLADAVISASVPLTDMLRVGGSVARLSRGGFGDNLTNGLENYNKDVWAGRGSIELGDSGGDGVLMRLTGDYTRDKSDPRNGHRLITSLQSGQPVLDDVYDTRAGLNNPEQDVEAYGLAMNITVPLGEELTFKSISAWRKDTSFTPIDFDSLAVVDVDVPAVYRNEQLSQEFQLLYEGERLNGLIGFYYLDATSSTEFDVLLSTTVPGLNAYTFGNVKTDTWSVFGDFTFDFTEQLSLSLGGRFTSDKRDARVLRQTKLGTSEVFGGNPVVLATTSNFNGEETYEEFTPRASLSYKPSDDHLIYASYSKGFKGGGFDPRGLTTAARDFNGNGVVDEEDIFEFMEFDPETVDSYEIGWKANFLDNRIRFALAGFYADYKNVQIPGSAGFDSNGDGVFDTFIGITTNAAKARLKGIEFEGFASVARDFAGDGSAFNLSGSLGYIDAEYLEYIDNFGNDVSDLRAIQNTPEWTASGTLELSLPVGGGMLDALTTVSYRAKTNQFEVPSPFLDQPGYTLWDASLVWTSPDDRYSLGLHAKNITDKQYITSGYQFLVTAPDGTPLLDANGNLRPSLGREGVVTAFYGNPRQIFMSAGVKF